MKTLIAIVCGLLAIAVGLRWIWSHNRKLNAAEHILKRLSDENVWTIEELKDADEDDVLNGIDINDIFTYLHDAGYVGYKPYVSARINQNGLEHIDTLHECAKLWSKREGEDGSEPGGY